MTNALTELVCTGRDGVQRTFYFECERASFGSPPSWTIRVHRRNPPNENVDDWYELVLQEREPAQMMVTMMRHDYRPWYTGMGISEAAMLRAAKLLRRTVISSSNRCRKTADEFRTSAAEKVWRRLEARGLAYYNSDEDRFTLTPP